MKRILLLVCLFSVAGVSASAADFYPQNEALSIIQKVLKEKDIQISESIIFNESSNIGHRMLAYVINREDSDLKNYAIFTESKGRYDLFDYLVITDNKGIVLKVSVVKYRSEHGGEIASKKWLAQFINYSGGNLQYGKDISAISGATLSASSITSDIQKVVVVLQQRILKDFNK